MTSPIAVEYAITPLGRTLEGPFQVLHAWACDHRMDAETAQQTFDGQVAVG